MDRERQRIEEDLTGLIAGEVRCDPIFRQLYASDAGLFAMDPLGVVRPRSTADVVATVQYAAAHGIPLHARGAGTGQSGGAIGPGLVIDFARFMRKIGPLDGETVRVQPGVVLELLNRRLAKHGRQFGPDPAKRRVTTLGGVISIDAAGSHWLRYGAPRQHVESLEVVLADGSVLELGRHPLEPRSDSRSPDRTLELVRAVAGLFQRHADVIESHRRRTRVNTSGYCVDNVLQDGVLDLTQLVTGSEGTLALITGMTLRTELIPVERGCVLLFFDRLEKAAHAATETLSHAPSACDLMDRRHLNLARESDVRFELLIPGEAEAVLLVEFCGDDRNEIRWRIREIVDKIERRAGLAAGAYVASDLEDVALCWRLAQSFTPALSRMKGQTRPVPFVEDFAVLPEHLAGLLASIQDVLKRHAVMASLFAHAGHGQVHLRPFLDLTDPRERLRLVALADELYDIVWQLDGTISGEHGDGLCRTPYLERQFGPLCDVFHAIKRIFDPDGSLNPGKIVPLPPMEPLDLLNGATYPAILSETVSSDPIAPSDRVASEVAPAGETPQLFDLQLNWQPNEFQDAVETCNRCGICRDETGAVRMCPIMHFAPREEASPRAKASLLSAVLSGRLPSDAVTSDDFKQLADLCVHCHMCRVECPAEVDIPRLMIEAKAAYIRDNGMKLGQSLLVRIDRLAAAASRLPLVANWALRSRVMRWLAEKTLGISANRRLPKLARRSFLQETARRRRRRAAPPGGDTKRPPVDRVAFLVDTYVNYFDVQLAEAMIAILEHNGVSVVVPPDQTSAGMPLVAHGVLDAARDVARQNSAAFAELARDGHTIVTTEPSAALAVSHEYPVLLPDDEDTLIVAGATQEACQFLWKLHLRGQLQLDFRPLDISVGYHAPCHLKALGIGTPSENLLRLIPGLAVETWEKGCSGMAGLFGLARRNYHNSIRAGMPLITTIRESNAMLAATECCTCKMQIEHATSTPTVHPIKLIAWAYGLIPDSAIERSLVEPVGRKKDGRR